MSRILIADNNSAERQYFRDLAQMRSILCDEAYDGGKAIALAAMHQYDLIMLDMNIPGVGVRGVLSYFADHQPPCLERTIVTAHDAQDTARLLEGLPGHERLRILSKRTESMLIEDIIRSYSAHARLPIRTSRN